MTKHTQGNWGVATIDGGEADDEIIAVVNGCTVNIAAVFGACEYGEMEPDGNGGSRECATYTVSKEEATANAQLLEAAPELLATIKAICEAFPSMRGLNQAQMAAVYKGCAIVQEVER